MLSDRTVKALEGISKASRSGARAKKLHKVMRGSEDLWFHAYARIQSNRGAITPGVTGNTLDGFGRERVLALMAFLREGTYRPTPVRRTYILKDPMKPDGKKRPLGIPTGDDKLVQEVARTLLEAIYEPVFTDRSHGFRPGRSCHTALKQIVDSWKGTKWVCELDIKSYFDSIDHEVLLAVLEKRIDDRAFLDLIRLFLRAGYLEDWKYHATYSGTPQGGVISPILANIYLHELDQFMEERIAAFNKGDRRKPSKAYKALTYQLGWRRKFLREHGEAHARAATVLADIAEMSERLRTMPSVDMHDPGFKRLHYVRYADDVRHITWRWIPFAERRGLEEMTLGPAAYPMVKAKGDSSMPSKRERSEDAYGPVPQGPRDMVRTGLFEPQPPAMQAYIPRHSVSCRGHRDRTAKSSSSEPSTRWAMGDHPIQGSGRGTYVALDTSSIKGMWDRPPRREAQGDGAAIVLRGRESRPHGEGRQVS